MGEFKKEEDMCRIVMGQETVGCSQSEFKLVEQRRRSTSIYKTDVVADMVAGRGQRRVCHCAGVTTESVWLSIFYLTVNSANNRTLHFHVFNSQS